MKACLFLLLTINWAMCERTVHFSLEPAGNGFDHFIRLKVDDVEEEEKEHFVLFYNPSTVDKDVRAKIKQLYDKEENKKRAGLIMALQPKDAQTPEEPDEADEPEEEAHCVFADAGIDITGKDIELLIHETRVKGIDVKFEEATETIEEAEATTDNDWTGKIKASKVRNFELKIESIKVLFDEATQKMTLEIKELAGQNVIDDGNKDKEKDAYNQTAEQANVVDTKDQGSGGRKLKGKRMVMVV